MENYEASLLPSGFRFQPSDEQLVHYYLRRKIRGEPLPAGIIMEFDLYGDKNPWEILDKNSKESFYVFTKLKKKRKRMYDRRAGSGTWRGVSKRKENQDDDDDGVHVSWVKKDYVFVIDKKNNKAKNGDDDNGHWLMAEYSFNQTDQQEDQNNYVLCRIWNKKPKCDHQMQPAAVIGHKRNFNSVNQSSQQNNIINVESEPEPEPKKLKLIIDDDDTDNINSGLSEINMLPSRQIGSNSEFGDHYNNFTYSGNPNNQIPSSHSEYGGVDSLLRCDNNNGELEVTATPATYMTEQQVTVDDYINGEMSLTVDDYINSTTTTTAADYQLENLSPNEELENEKVLTPTAAHSGESNIDCFDDATQLVADNNLEDFFDLPDDLAFDGVIDFEQFPVPEYNHLMDIHCYTVAV